MFKESKEVKDIYSLYGSIYSAEFSVQSYLNELQESVGFDQLLEEDHIELTQLIETSEFISLTEEEKRNFLQKIQDRLANSKRAGFLGQLERTRRKVFGTDKERNQTNTFDNEHELKNNEIVKREKPLNNKGEEEQQKVEVPVVTGGSSDGGSTTSGTIEQQSANQQKVIDQFKKEQEAERVKNAGKDAGKLGGEYVQQKKIDAKKISPASFSTNQRQTREILKNQSGKNFPSLEKSDLNQFNRTKTYTADDGKTQLNRSTVFTKAKFDFGNIKKGQELGVLTRNQRKQYDLKASSFKEEVTPKKTNPVNNNTSSTNPTGVMRTNNTGSGTLTTNRVRSNPATGVQEQIGGMTKSATNPNPNLKGDEPPVYIKWSKNVTGREGLTQSQKDAVKKHELKHSYHSKSDNKGHKPTLDIRKEDVSIDENRMASHTAGMSDAQKDAASSSISKSAADKWGRRNDEAAFKGRKKKTSARYSSTGGKKRKNTTGRGQPEQYRKSADSSENEARFPYGRSKIVQGKGSFKGLKKEDFDAFEIVLGYLQESGQVDSIDEALYVMMEMDAATIQGIVRDFENLYEEAADKVKDDRLVKYGIGHDGSDKKGGSGRRSGKKPKGKTPLQKETEKKYGKGKTAVEIVRKKIEDEHGKGAIA